MFIDKNIKNGFESLVGWRNNTLPDLTLDPVNEKTDSGLYFNDISPIVTLENLFFAASPENMDDDAFNSYLVRVNETAVLRVLNDIFFEKSDFVCNSGGRMDATDKTPNQINDGSGLFGFEIQVNTEEYLIQLNKATFYSVNDETFKLKLINTNHTDPLKEWDVELIANNEKTIELNIPIDGTVGGRFYLVVEKSELVGEIFAFNQNGESLGLVDVFNCEIDAAGKTKYIGIGQLFTLDYSIYSDFTEFVIKNKRLFARAIQTAGAIETLETMLTSVRSNFIQRIGDRLAGLIYETLNGGEKPRSVGLVITYENAIKNVRAQLFKKPRLFKTTLTNTPKHGRNNQFERF